MRFMAPPEIECALEDEQVCEYRVTLQAKCVSENITSGIRRALLPLLRAKVRRIESQMLRDEGAGSSSSHLNLSFRWHSVFVFEGALFAILLSQCHQIIALLECHLQFSFKKKSWG